MTAAPSSTWFTAPPHWEWYIVLYFFLGGLAGGCYLIASLLDLFNRPEDRWLARLGHYVAFPCIVVSGALLTLDLGQPLRFWHMLFQSHTFRPMFKYWSPMSIGSWALSIFGLFTFLSFMAALAEEDRLRWPRLRDRLARFPVLRRLRPPSPIGRVLAVVGSLLGLYVAGYTGVLLAVTNRPIWSDTPLLGMLFVVSAASTSAALLILLAHRRRGTGPAHASDDAPGVVALHRFDDWVILLELIVLGAVLISLGPVLQAWLNLWGVTLALVIVGGLLVPLWLSWRTRHTTRVQTSTAAVLVLIGGFLLRVVIIFSAQAV